MSFTFIKALGGNVGDSLVEEDKLHLALDIIERAKANGVNLCLPLDSINADKFENNANKSYSLVGNIPEGFMGLDIGPKTVDNFKTYIEKSSKIIWNGPLGVFELDNYAEDSRQIMVALSTSKATTVIGGGDTASCCDKFGLSDKMTHVSTGGGAALELLEGKRLPGLFL